MIFATPVTMTLAVNGPQCPDMAHQQHDNAYLNNNMPSLDVETIHNIRSLSTIRTTTITWYLLSLPEHRTNATKPVQQRKTPSVLLPSRVVN